MRGCSTDPAILVAVGYAWLRLFRMENTERHRAAESASERALRIFTEQLKRRELVAAERGHPEWADLPMEAGGARCAGTTRFFTGYPCKHGHVAPRQAGTGTCCVCSNGYMRDYMGKRRRVEGALPRLVDRRVDGVMLLSPKEVQRVFGRGGRATEGLGVEATHKYWTRVGQRKPYQCAADAGADVEAVMQQLGAVRWIAV